MKLQTGEYFLTEHTRRRKADAERVQREGDKAKERALKRQATLQPPIDETPRAKKTHMVVDAPVDVKRLKKKLSKKQIAM